MRKRKDPQIAYCFTLPQDEGGELITALLSVDEYEYKSEFTNSQMAVAGATMAANFAPTAGFDPPMAFQNLGIFAETVSKRAQVSAARTGWPQFLGSHR